jgi:hypothetical protein
MMFSYVLGDLKIILKIFFGKTQLCGCVNLII